MKQLYIIDYENAHWCGGQLNVCVWAESAEEAEMLAANHMDETQTELFADEYGESIGEDEEYADECTYAINSVSVLDENSEHWKYFQDPSQKEFYPVINSKE